MIAREESSQMTVVMRSMTTPTTKQYLCEIEIHVL